MEKLEVLWTDEWVSKAWCTVGQSQRERLSPTLTTHEIKRQSLQPSFLGEIYNAEPTEIEVQCSRLKGVQRGPRGVQSPSYTKQFWGPDIQYTHACTQIHAHTQLTV